MHYWINYNIQFHKVTCNTTRIISKYKTYIASKLFKIDLILRQKPSSKRFSSVVMWLPVDQQSSVRISAGPWNFLLYKYPTVYGNVCFCASVSFPHVLLCFLWRRPLHSDGQKTRQALQSMWSIVSSSITRH